MKKARKLAAVALLLMPVGLVRPVLAADDLGKVMARLDEESARFKSASADIAWDNVQVRRFPIRISRLARFFSTARLGGCRWLCI